MDTDLIIVFFFYLQDYLWICEYVKMWRLWHLSWWSLGNGCRWLYDFVFWYELLFQCVYWFVCISNRWSLWKSNIDFCFLVEVMKDYLRASRFKSFSFLTNLTDKDKPTKTCWKIKWLLCISINTSDIKGAWSLVTWHLLFIWSHDIYCSTCHMTSIVHVVTWHLLFNWSHDI